MTERIYNLILFITNGFITELGAVEHEIEGSDQDKHNFLKQNVSKDVSECSKFPVPNRYKIEYSENRIVEGLIHYQKYLELHEIGLSNELFEEVFEYYNSSRSPLICTTCCVNGQIAVDGPMEIKNAQDHFEEIHFYTAPDYLTAYTDERGFNAGQLITDDFFKPIGALLKVEYYISSMKLLLSAIDSFAYIEYGDRQNNFIMWLNSFMQLDRLGVTAEEVWEMRNSIVHMTNSDSRKVTAGKVSRIILQVGISIRGISNVTYDGKFLRINEFYLATAKAVENWLAAVFKEGRIEKFVQRYDQIVSESRLGRIILK
jgi:hypothetical protein